MIAFWLTWMWINRAFMLLAAVNGAYAIADGRHAAAIVSAACLLLNAANAELCRRQAAA